MKKFLCFLLLILFSVHSFVFSQESIDPKWSLLEMQEILSALLLQDMTMNRLLPDFLKEFEKQIESEKYANKLLTVGQTSQEVFVKTYNEKTEELSTKKYDEKQIALLITDEDEMTNFINDKGEMTKLITYLSKSPEEIHGALSLTKKELTKIFKIIFNNFKNTEEERSNCYKALHEYINSENPFFRRFGLLIREILENQKSPEDQNPKMMALGKVHVENIITLEVVINCPECSWISNPNDVIRNHLHEVYSEEKHHKKIELKETFLLNLTKNYENYQEKRDTYYSFYENLRKRLWEKINYTAGKNNNRKRVLIQRHAKSLLSPYTIGELFNEERNFPEFLFEKEITEKKDGEYKTKHRTKRRKKKVTGKGKKHAYKKEREDRKAKPLKILIEASSKEEAPNRYLDRCPDGQCGICKTCQRFMASHSKKTAGLNGEEAPKSKAQQTKIEDNEVIEETDIFILINNPSEKQTIRLYKLKRESFLTPEKIPFLYHQRVINMFDNTLDSQQVTGDHAFTRMVDNYLFDFGIKSTDPSKQDNGNYFNIHLPGEKISNDGQEIKYGVFSYGFFKEQHGVTYCYHRCFTKKPKSSFIWDYIKEGYRNVQLASLAGSWQQQTN